MVGDKGLVRLISVNTCTVQCRQGRAPAYRAPARKNVHGSIQKHRFLDHIGSLLPLFNDIGSSAAGIRTRGQEKKQGGI